MDIACDQLRNVRVHMVNFQQNALKPDMYTTTKGILALSRDGLTLQRNFDTLCDKINIAFLTREECEILHIKSFFLQS